MHCKNCNYTLNSSSKFCENCGAKVVNRISLKSLIAEFVENVFGWDNKYFATVKGLILHPNKLLSSYLNGTRKRYMNPMGFLVINLTLVLFIFNIFSDEYLSMAEKSGKEQTAWMAENFGGIYAEETYQKESIERNNKIQKFMLNYMNIATLLSLPLYALMSWLVFRKKHNYGEHLVINSYLLGFSFIFSALFFIISISINPSIYLLSIIFTIFFYSNTYKKLYSLSFAEIILKLLIFIGILIGVFIVLFIITAILTVVFLIIRDKFL